MRDLPGPQGLLSGARRVLERDIVPALDGQRRFAAMLVSRALAVAARAVAAGNAPSRAELGRLQALLGRPVAGPGDPDDLEPELRALNRELATRIRMGVFDERPRRQALYDHLRQVTRDKLVESNPKHLEAPGR